MAKSQTKTEESGQVIYAQSEPFREIVQALFPNHSWEYFLENLDQEEFAWFLEFIWYIRPDHGFRAFNGVPERISEIKNAMGEDAAMGSIPWDHLKSSAQKILDAINAATSNQRVNQQERFKAFYVGRRQNSMKNGAMHFSNPMYTNGCGNFLLYSCLQNDFDAATNVDDVAMQQKLTYARRLTGLVYGQYHELASKEIAGNLLSQEKVRLEGQRLIKANLLSEANHSRFKKAETIVRRLSSQWLKTDLALELGKLLELPGEQFRKQASIRIEDIARTLQEDGFNNDEEGEHPLAELASLLKILVELPGHRGSGGAGGGGSRNRRYDPGAHIFADHFLGDISGEEDRYGDPIIRRSIWVPPLTSDELEEFEESGEDPTDDFLEPPIERIKYPKGKGSRLRLDQSSSYSQRLLASNNQRISWDQKTLTAAELALFRTFLNKKEREAGFNTMPYWATIALRMVVILGIKLSRALEVMGGPEKPEEWLKGRADSKFGLNLPEDLIESEKELAQRCPLMALKSTIGDREIYLWRYKICSYAYLDRINQNQANHWNHADTIVFFDSSGIAKILVERYEAKACLGYARAFSEIEAEQISGFCQQYLDQFNQAHDLGIGERKVSFGTLKQYGNQHLIQSGVDQAMVDLLDWDLPKYWRPALHYLTHDLHSYVDAGATGLQKVLMDRTRLFGKKDFLLMPPTQNPILGSTGLIDMRAVKNGIAQIIKDIRGNLSEEEAADDMELWVYRWNRYTLLTSLWFCMESSNRPHKVPYVTADQIDSIFGSIVLRDKSNAQGDKDRLAWISKPLREHMEQYDGIADRLQKMLIHSGVSTQKKMYPLVLLEFNEQKGLIAKPYTGKQLRKEIGAVFNGAEPNFYRKFVPHVLKDQDLRKVAVKKKKEAKSLASPSELPLLDGAIKNAYANELPEELIRVWLGHWVTGTSPYHSFGGFSFAAYAKQMGPRLQSLMKRLGFKPVTLTIPKSIFASRALAIVTNQ